MKNSFSESGPERNPDIMKGSAFWIAEIKKAGVHESLRHFNDLLTGYEAPGGYGEPVLTDVVLDQRKCDIYHTDKEPNDSWHRIYIHIKE